MENRKSFILNECNISMKYNIIGYCTVSNKMYIDPTKVSQMCIFRANLFYYLNFKCSVYTY